MYPEASEIDSTYSFVANIELAGLFGKLETTFPLTEILGIG
jgi:hypothetical protein